ncbi:hypothetical protein ACHQM5_000279 [Ranunculus cassubicifolius]
METSIHCRAHPSSESLTDVGLEGGSIAFASARVQLQNTDKGKDNFNEDCFQTPVSQDFLRNVSNTMFNLNDFTYTDYQFEEPRRALVEMKPDDASLSSLLISLNNEKYLAIEKNGIDMATLMSYDMNHFRKLGIPIGPAMKLLAELHCTVMVTDSDSYPSPGSSGSRRLVFCEHIEME